MCTCAQIKSKYGDIIDIMEYSGLIKAIKKMLRNLDGFQENVTGQALPLVKCTSTSA